MDKKETVYLKDFMAKTTKILVVLVSFFSTIFFWAKSASAQDVCDVETNMYSRNLLTELTGIPLTAKDFFTASIGSTFSTATGFGLTETVKCSDYILTVLEKEDVDDTGFVRCSGTSEAVCQEIAGPTAYAPGEDYLMKYAQSRSSGSLLGLAYFAETFSHREPLPANLAIYTNDVLSRVPFVGKAYAADYGHSLIDAMLEAWKVFRNLAYALMAIILLYTGIVIILRRKISSQLVVSVQYALPRIVIAIVLITFSYPIGATLGSLGWTLFKSNWLIASSFFTNIIENTGASPTALQMWTVLVPLWPMLLNGQVSLVAMLIVVVVYLIAGLIFNIKAIIIYMKILFTILTAPIEFAMGAVPGNDDKMKGWFMRMAKYILTLFGMGLIVPLGTVIAILIVNEVAPETAGTIGSGARIFSMGLPAFVVLYCFGLGIGMEKRIEDFMGMGKRR